MKIYIIYEDNDEEYDCHSIDIIEIHTNVIEAFKRHYILAQAMLNDKDKRKQAKKYYTYPIVYIEEYETYPSDESKVIGSELPDWEKEYPYNPQCPVCKVSMRDKSSYGLRGYCEECYKTHSNDYFTQEYD